MVGGRAQRPPLGRRVVGLDHARPGTAVVADRERDAVREQHERVLGMARVSAVGLDEVARRAPLPGRHVIKLRRIPGGQDLSGEQEYRRGVLGRVELRAGHRPHGGRRIEDFAGRRPPRVGRLAAAACHQTFVGEADQRRVPALLIEVRHRRPRVRHQVVGLDPPNAIDEVAGRVASLSPHEDEAPVGELGLHLAALGGRAQSGIELRLRDRIKNDRIDRAVTVEDAPIGQQRRRRRADEKLRIRVADDRPSPRLCLPAEREVGAGRAGDRDGPFRVFTPGRRRPDDVCAGRDRGKSVRPISCGARLIEVVTVAVDDRHASERDG